jgi:hypothetical protein
VKDMNILNKFTVKKLIDLLVKHGYKLYAGNTVHVRYCKSFNDNVWIRNNTFNIVQCNKGTKAEKFLTAMYGAPTAEYISKNLQHSHSGWDFNGYQLHNKGTK